LTVRLAFKQIRVAYGRDGAAFAISLCSTWVGFMLRVVITALVVAAIAGAVLYMVMSRNAQVQQAQQEQIEQLNAQLAAAQKENLNLKIALSKVQTEEQNLAMQNDALSKAIAQYKATGKMPAVNLPYPPK
jgi:uncharacterized membrane protein (DUF106 family)